MLNELFKDDTNRLSNSLTYQLHFIAFSCCPNTRLQSVLNLSIPSITSGYIILGSMPKLLHFATLFSYNLTKVKKSRQSFVHYCDQLRHDLQVTACHLSYFHLVKLPLVEIILPHTDLFVANL